MINPIAHLAISVTIESLVTSRASFQLLRWLAARIAHRKDEGSNDFAGVWLWYRRRRARHGTVVKEAHLEKVDIRGALRCAVEREPRVTELDVNTYDLNATERVNN